MEIKKAEFIKSAMELKDCPKAFFPEVSFVGRSNVGKSSLINLICNNKKLAQTSETPGKTRTINYFLINGKWYLVDLPGYGFAKVSRAEREKFQKMIKEYIKNRKTLKCTMLLIDSRLDLQSSDKEFLYWLAKNNLPFAIVLTKTDKLSKTQLKEQSQYFEKELSKIFEEIPNIFYTSVPKKTGRTELLDFFEYILNNTNQ